MICQYLDLDEPAEARGGLGVGQRQRVLRSGRRLAAEAAGALQLGRRVHECGEDPARPRRPALVEHVLPGLVVGVVRPPELAAAGLAPLQSAAGAPAPSSRAGQARRGTTALDGTTVEAQQRDSAFLGPHRWAAWMMRAACVSVNACVELAALSAAAAAAARRASSAALAAAAACGSGPHGKALS
eukprot:SAG22_NODE_1069_length_5726_cov_20.690954_5_plen_185_part_00